MSNGIVLTQKPNVPGLVQCSKCVGTGSVVFTKRQGDVAITVVAECSVCKGVGHTTLEANRAEIQRKRDWILGSGARRPGVTPEMPADSPV